MSETNPAESSPGLPVHVPFAVPQTEKPKKLEDFLKENPNLLGDIPPEKIALLAKMTVSKTQVSYSRSGLLPDPSELAAYNEIIPNGAERIMKMAEVQSTHRMHLEKTVVESQQAQESKGQWFGFIIAILFGGGGLYAALKGQPWFGGIIAGTTLVSLAGIFVYSKQQSRKDLGNKQDSSMKPGVPSQSGISPSADKPTKV